MAEQIVLANEVLDYFEERELGIDVVLRERAGEVLVGLAGDPDAWSAADLARLGEADPLVLAKCLYVGRIQAAQKGPGLDRAVDRALAGFRRTRRLTVTFIRVADDHPAQARLPAPMVYGTGSATAAGQGRTVRVPVTDLNAALPTYRPFVEAYAKFLAGKLEPERRRVPVAELAMEPAYWREEFVGAMLPDIPRRYRTKQERGEPVWAMERRKRLWVYDDCHYVQGLKRTYPDAVVECAIFRDRCR